MLPYILLILFSISLVVIFLILSIIFLGDGSKNYKKKRDAFSCQIDPLNYYKKDCVSIPFREETESNKNYEDYHICREMEKLCVDQELENYSTKDIQYKIRPLENNGNVRCIINGYGHYETKKQCENTEKKKSKNIENNNYHSCLLANGSSDYKCFYIENGQYQNLLDCKNDPRCANSKSNFFYDYGFNELGIPVAKITTNYPTTNTSKTDLQQQLKNFITPLKKYSKDSNKYYVVRGQFSRGLDQGLVDKKHVPIRSTSDQYKEKDRCIALDGDSIFNSKNYENHFKNQLIFTDLVDCINYSKIFQYYHYDPTEKTCLTSDQPISGLTNYKGDPKSSGNDSTYYQYNKCLQDNKLMML